MKKILLALALMGSWATSCQSINTIPKTRALSENIQPLLLSASSITLGSLGHILYQSSSLQDQITATLLMVFSVVLASYVPRYKVPGTCPLEIYVGQPNFYITPLLFYRPMYTMPIETPIIYDPVYLPIYYPY